MTNILQGFTGGSVPTITNPFQPFPLPTPAEAAGSLSGIGLTPDQQSFLDLFTGQGDTIIGDIYSRLGLEGSTMEGQDRAANRLRTAAEASTLESGNINQAIQEQQVSGGQQLSLAQLATNAGLATQRNQLAASGQAFQQGNTALSNLSNLVSAFVPV